MNRETDNQSRRRLATIFGWVAGASLGLVVNGITFTLWGPGYPLAPTTFVFFVGGAFGGMKVADRYGARAFAPLGISAGLLLAFALATIFMVMGAGDDNF